MQNRWARAVVGFVCGLVGFFAIAWVLKRALGGPGAEAGSEPTQEALRHYAVLSQVVLKKTLIVVSLAAWKLLGRPFREMGWRAARWNWSYLPWLVLTAVAMMAASVVMVLMERVHPIASQMRLWEIVLVIWLLSSFSEEIYVRGLVQSWISNGGERAGVRSAFEPSVVASAMLFSAMHVPLIWSPAGLKGGLTLAGTMLVVGWACAVLRDRSRSLWWAIACHVLGNAAGLPGGIIGVIVFRVIHGRLPDFVKAALGQ
jgi:membrane protease YdiL (CAAX protease family)